MLVSNVAYNALDIKILHFLLSLQIQFVLVQIAEAEGDEHCDDDCIQGSQPVNSFESNATGENNLTKDLLP